jgi:hypothetical protein
MNTETQASETAVIEPTPIAPVVVEPAPTETLPPITDTPLDPITGSASPTGAPTNTSNNNQILVNSPIYNPTNSHNTYNYTSNYNDNSTQITQLTPTCATSELQKARLGREYLFDSSLYFRRSSKKPRIDRITNFSAESGDILKLARNTFKGIGELDFVATANKRASKQAAKTDKDIIYELSSGKLYFNANTEDKGFGKQGGLFAILEGSPVIGSSNFILV